MTPLERTARAICETGNIYNFKCVCPHPVHGWCRGGRQRMKAEAALFAVHFDELLAALKQSVAILEPLAREEFDFQALEVFRAVLAKIDTEAKDAEGTD